MNQGKLKVYGDARSGNCYKIQLLCAEMGIEYDWEEVDILAGDTHTPQFLEMNPNGKIPTLALPDGRFLSESNAILFYLADGSEFFAGDSYARAQILQWMNFEQYSHEPNIATSRFIIKYLGNPPDRQRILEEKRTAGYKALDVMERQLERWPFITGDKYTIADIALYAYTHVADQGGFDLGDYPGVRAWMDRITQRPKYVPMAEK
ncbi:MAG: glutathione S-transferase family protein [Woeseiaceae bacterium]|nr:glutathione S-transferase family protein [Woeseiaceae bacterium]